MSKYKIGDVFDMRDPTCSSHAKGQITRHFRIGGIEKYEVALLERSIWSGKMEDDTLQMGSYGGRTQGIHHRGCGMTAPIEDNEPQERIDPIEKLYIESPVIVLIEFRKRIELMIEQAEVRGSKC